MIELKNISYAYPGQPPLLENITTAFADGKITSILGPNGCGKSTLLKIICRLLTPSAGKILLHGNDVHTMKTKAFAKEVALLAQTNHPPEITVEDLVAYGRYPHQKYGRELTKNDKEITGIICIVDMLKRDSEIKILIGCTEEETAIVYETHNETDSMKGILIRR